MFEESAQGIESTDLEGLGLQDQIAHWVDVLDRWVKDLDRGMGRNGADTTSEPTVEDVGAGS